MRGKPACRGESEAHTAERGHRRHRHRLYAPQLWYSTMDYPWNDYPHLLAALLPGIAAFLPGVFIRYQTNTCSPSLSGVLPSAAAAVRYIVSQRSTRSFYIAVGILFAWSIASAVVAHFMFRA